MSNAYYHSLEQAARAVGRRKSTIYNAIKTGKVSGEKDHKGRWKILKGELHRVYPEVSLNEQENVQTGNHETDNELIEIRVKVKILEEQLAREREINEDLKEDRNHWRDQAERASLLLTDQRPKKKTVLNRIFGAG